MFRVIQVAVIFLLEPSLSAAPLEWHSVNGGRYAELAVNASSKPGFSLTDNRATGVLFTNFISEERHLTNQILLNGSGVAAGDVDGDGWCDLYFCSLRGGNKLFRNLGNWHFEDMTAQAGVSCNNLDASGCAFADIDGDGDLDLIVNSVAGGTHIFLNDGKGHFTESIKNQGLNLGRAGMSLALADIDGDGALDLYVANYRVVTLRDEPNTHFSIKMVNGQPVVDAVNGRLLTAPDLTNRFKFTFKTTEEGTKFNPEENGEPDLICRNDGHGRFVPLSFTDGTFLDEQGRALSQAPLDWGLSVMFRDLNGDGLPDIYVCNDFSSPDRIWINQGDGRFRAIPPLAIRETCRSSMGIDVADLNRDGFDELFVVDMLSRDHVHRQSQRVELHPQMMLPGRIDNRPQYGRNMLYLNRGDGTYAELAQMAGLEATEWSWTPMFLDVDLDGYEDLLISNGFERDGMNVDVLRKLDVAKRERKLSNLEHLQLRKLFPKLQTANLAFRNLGGMRFEDVSTAWGFDLKGVSQGMALADLDNDGDLDLVINNLNGAASLFRNNAPAPRLAVRLKGKSPNTHGIGARIKVFGGPVAQSQEIICGGRYLSSDDATRTFAAGQGDMRIEVTWRNGKRSTISGARANRIYEVDEAVAADIAKTDVKVPAALFQDVSERIKHVHVDEFFDDFALQPLLPKRLSQLGPGLCWFDYDNDGWDDLVIGSGRGGQLALFRNDGKGGFERVSGGPYDQPITRDQTAVLGLRRSATDTVLLAGSANYEDGLTAGSVVRQYDSSKRAVIDSLQGSESSTGPLALADVDGDGELDLFVGGRVIAGKYPETASSMLFRGQKGAFLLDEVNRRTFENLGLMSGAVFSDLNGDGFPELVLACEWGPVRVFRNDHGRFTEATGQLGLARYTGWWNGVAVGDFDADGRMDILAANWGSNSKYQSFRRPSILAYYGDIDGNGIWGFIEAYMGSGRLLPLQALYTVGAAIPFLNEKFPTFDAYAHATLGEIYGDKLNLAKKVEVTWLESTLFLNRGDHFEVHALPLEAQMAPAFAVCVADFDGDGAEDLFLSQNFFATHPETSRYDAGRGLCLLGDGHGNFRSLAGQESGIAIYGEQRGAAVCDFDGDGRVDLAIAQNSAATKVYHNERADPGLRIRLVGAPGNVQAIGATIRTGDGRQWGPAREIHAGSGYWSQDSAVQVMSRPKAARMQVWVRWPGSATTVSDIPKTAGEISIATSGAVTVIR